MSRVRFWTILAAGAVASISTAPAAASSQSSFVLQPGDRAPSLTIRAWYKGKPVKALPAKGLAVVEFWATWCSPCRETIPHLTKFQKSNPDVMVLGVGIWEDHDPAKINRFVKEMGSQMDYKVAYSGNMDGMAASWMAASKSESIPTAFVVKDRRIMWIGHPSQLESVVKQVRGGTWDTKAARTVAQKSARRGAETQKLVRLGAEANEIYKAKGAAAALAEVRRRRPEFEVLLPEMDDLEITYLAHVDWEAWTMLVRKAVKRKSEETSISIVEAAWKVLDDPGKRDFVKKVITFGLEAVGKQDVAFTLTAARAYRKAGMLDDASQMLDLAEKAVPATEQGAALRRIILDMRSSIRADKGAKAPAP